ncbi:MAG: hypothetical protein KY391_05255 [Actinobacteria bacterium]|nr:hypothetical protein [Actinomycetota bacterium]
MGGTFQFYFDAATVLWEASVARLEELSANAKPEALRRAAQDALMMKAQFMMPDGLDDERKAVSILAASLQDDPEFTADVAVQLTRQTSPTKTPPPPARSIGRSRSRPKAKVALWVAVITACLLLALEVLATAGAAVPNPIGELIERLTEDEPNEGVNRAPSTMDASVEHRHDVGRGGVGMPFATRTTTAVEKNAKGRTKTKNPNHANGRERNQKDKDKKNKKDKRQKTYKRHPQVGAVVSAHPPKPASGRGHARPNRAVKKGNRASKNARD